MFLNTIGGKGDDKNIQSNLALKIHEELWDSNTTLCYYMIHNSKVVGSNIDGNKLIFIRFSSIKAILIKI